MAVSFIVRTTKSKGDVPISVRVRSSILDINILQKTNLLVDYDKWRLDRSKQAWANFRKSEDGRKLFAKLDAIEDAIEKKISDGVKLSSKDVQEIVEYIVYREAREDEARKAAEAAAAEAARKAAEAEANRVTFNKYFRLYVQQIENGERQTYRGLNFSRNSFRNIRTSMRKWEEFQASKHTENIHMRRQFPLSLLALVITIIAIHLVSCTKSLDDPGNSYLEWQKMSEGDYGIYVEAVQAFLEDDTNLDSPYYSAIKDMESFRPTGIRVQTGEAPAYGEVKAYLFNCGSWLVEVLKKSDDETSTVTACFNASVIDENAILSAAGKRWSTLVEDLRNYYSYLPIKANETVFSKMYVDCEDGRRNISYYADVSKDGDYAFWVIPKQPEYVNAIIYTLKRDYPSCFWTIIEPTDPENLQDCNIHCKMPAIDQRWCKILCGLENPRDWHTDVNGGLIQKEYKSKSSNLQLDYVRTRVMLMNKKGEEADAIFGKSLEDMTKAQNDVIGDLIAANDNFQKIVIF